MEQEEIIKHLHEALNSVDITFPYRYVFAEAIEALSQPSFSSNLEEAADKQAFIESPYSWESQPGTFGSTPLFLMSNIRSAFIAGAEWAFRQGWTFDAHKGAFGICFDGNIDNLLDSLKDKEEVTVQIRKK